MILDGFGQEAGVMTAQKKDAFLWAATVELGIVSFSNLLGRLILMWTLK